MRKTIKVSFSEQSKAVVSDVSIEYELTNQETGMSNKSILEETEELFNQAQKFALNATFQRNK